MDATFVTQELRRRAAEIAGKHKMQLAILETKCSEQASVNRIQKRTKEEYVSNALTVEAYLANKKKFEPVDIVALKESVSGLRILHFIVDTEHDNPESWYVIQSERR